MLLFPAIDLYEGKAVRLYKGDYNQLTVYNENPAEVGKAFAAAGAKHIHIVDLEGAKSGTTPNLATVVRIKQESGLFCEIGGGVRNMDVVKTYIDAGLLIHQHGGTGGKTALLLCGDESFYLFSHVGHSLHFAKCF